MKKIYVLLLLAFLSVCTYNQSYAQTIVVTYSANATWVCPAGVTSVIVECWGGGGGGGGAKKSILNHGSGGGGGAYASQAIVVIPGNSYAVVVGAAGTQGTAAAIGGNGGSSTFNATSVVAVGGNGGKSLATTAANGVGGVGGLASASTGTTKYDGGDGFKGAPGNGGGGGGSAGSIAAGTNATNSTGAIGGANLGGDGGDGSTVAAGIGSAGAIYGGGGGGATCDAATSANKKGGAGAKGFVRLTYSTTPPNDNCAGAIDLTHNGEGTCTITNGSIEGATNSCAGPLDTWYSFTATATRARITVSAVMAEIIQVYSGACSGNCGGTSMGSFTNLGDNDITGLTIGDTYYFRIYNTGGTMPPDPTFTVCVTTQPGAPVNDDCAGAFTLTPSPVCNYVQYSNALATASSGMTAPGCGFAAASLNDVWFKVVVPATGTITIDTEEGVLTDADIALYTGTCGALTLVTCDDASSANGAMGLITQTGLTPGTTVYIRVWDRGNNDEGTFGICVTTPGGCSFSGIQTTDLGANTDECLVVCPSTLTVRDPGGAGNYANNSSATQTFTNSSGGPLQIDFSVFNTEATYDKVFIYDGNSTAAPQWVGSPWSGTTLPPSLISSGASITIKFTSDGSTAKPGFIAAITCLPACTGAPALGNAIANPASVCAGGSTLLQVTTGITPASGYTYQWQTGPTNAGAWTDIPGATSGTYLLTTGAAGTYYYRRVTTCTATGLSNNPNGAASTLKLVVNGLSAACYCTSGQTYGGDMEITQVTLPHTAGGAGSINRSTLYNGGTPLNDAAYSTNISNLMQSSTVTLTVGVTQDVYAYSFQIWAYFDWNQNGSFTDPGEYFQVKPYGTSPVSVQTNYTFAVTVPPTAVLGNTQMRIIAVESSTNPWDPCGTFGWGETEDYKINITPMPACAGVITAGATIVTPSSSCTTAPVSPSMSLTGNTAASGITYKWQSASYGAGPWTDIPGAIAPTHTLTNTIVTDTYFRCTLVCTNGGSTSSSAPGNISFVNGPANDLPCNATLVTMGAYTPGDNFCAGASAEPAATGCWTSGVLNTVWYKFVATSTSAKIKTYAGTLVRTQINVYTGACAGLTVVTGGCQADYTSCSLTQALNEFTVTGLTNGQTYYIRVDGDNDDFGTFTILVIDGASSFPTSPGQDCSIANPVCNQTQTISDPGFQGTGSVCEFTGTNNCTGGERGSGYYEINIGANGNLVFTITPNDGTTDYDFLLWKISGPSTYTNATCGTLTATTPVRCNYSYLGTTGLNGAADGNPTAAFMARLPVLNGDKYILVVSNFTNSTSGFDIDYGASPINYAPASATNLSWTGGIGKDWTNATNWGGCDIPSCTKDAVVPVFTNQPQITAAMGTITVKDLTINTGATLTLGAGAVLQVCGSIYNFGTIIASPTSTIIFTDNITTHTLSGNFTGISKLGNLTITDAAGAGSCTVTAASNIEVGGNFTTTDATSIFNSNGKIITVGGNFTNNKGGTTFSGVNTTTSALIFNGTAAQNYSQGTTILTLNNVTMNHSGSGVTLVGSRMELGSAGSLTLTNGVIITGAQEVRVLNNTATAVSAGNTNSYVQGNLRRSLPAASAGSYNFPVGTIGKGYQRANFNFTTTQTIDNLMAYFTDATTVTPGAVECAYNYNIASLNNGVWTVSAYNAAFGALGTTALGSYTCTLYPTNYTNSAASVQFTVYKKNATWAFNGTCSANASPAVVSRAGMNGFSDFAVAQSATILPVKMLNFTGKTIGMQNHLEWNTAKEVNSDYFVLERSKSGKEFVELTKARAQGKSNDVANYTEIDQNPFGTTYYRLKIVDKNGDYAYSEIITLSLPAVNFNIGIRPNPATDNLFVDLFASQNADAKIEIMDMLGKVVKENKVSLSSGNNTVDNDLSDLAKGSYFIKVSSANGTLYNGKFIKQ